MDTVSIMHLSKSIECTELGVDPKVNYWLWVIICQCKSINCNKCLTLMSDVYHRGGFACVGVEGMWETSVPSHYIYCEPKAALKKN